MEIFRELDTFDIVVVPFPFTDIPQSKRRPAIVLSSNIFFNRTAGHTVLAMITSALHKPWPLDTPIEQLSACGLEKPSLIRLKFFTLDNRLIQNKLGKLGAKDQELFKKNLSSAFNKLFKQ
jgi:mRNA interferase MazF